VDGLLTLSDPEGDAWIFLGSEGWVCEREEGARPIVDGEELCVGSSRWIVRINARTEMLTGAMPSELSLAGLDLVFQVSRDEEYVQVSARASGRTIDLGARAHHYLLLQLARRRLADSESGLPDWASGWVPMDEFGPTPRLNLDIFRIRSQFVFLGVKGGAAVIERSKERGIRIGIARLTIVSV
jgi:hypothetical protein